jgi:ATP-dependent Lon protease
VLADAMADGGATTENEPTQPLEFPAVVTILPLRGTLVYPLAAMPLRVAQPRSLRLIDDVLANKHPIGLVASKLAEKEEPGPDDIYRIGTLGAIARHFKGPDGVLNMIVQSPTSPRVSSRSPKNGR